MAMKVEASCPICTENFSLVKIRRRRVHQSCCEQHICLSCLHSHIKSILEEGVAGGDGRKELLCPYGCGSCISDATVRGCFRKKHATCKKRFSSGSIKRTVRWAGSRLRLISTTEDHAVRYKQYSKSIGEREDLRLYERWSLSVALSSFSTTGDHDVYTHVQYCPGLDCECIWLANKTFRKEKANNEQQRKDQEKHLHFRGGLKKKLFAHMKNQPEEKTITVDPEHEEEIMNRTGYTIAHWNTVDHIGGSGNKDGRCVSCPGCHYQFCGLCSRPWWTISILSRQRITHNAQLCSTYGVNRAHISDDNDFLLAARAGDAKCCPGCTMRTSRNGGCNHISCPCGFQWCYVCECPWNRTHYSCIQVEEALPMPLQRFRGIGVQNQGIGVQTIFKPFLCIVSLCTLIALWQFVQWDFNLPTLATHTSMLLIIAIMNYNCPSRDRALDFLSKCHRVFLTIFVLVPRGIFLCTVSALCIKIFPLIIKILLRCIIGALMVPIAAAFLLIFPIDAAFLLIMLLIWSICKL